MGPLQGLKIIEMAGLGPGPFCGMLLADMGADVICIERSAPPLLDLHEAPQHPHNRARILKRS